MAPDMTDWQIFPHENSKLKWHSATCSGEEWQLQPEHKSQLSDLTKDLLCKNLGFIPNAGTWGRVNSQINHMAEDYGNLNLQGELEMMLLV